MEFSVTHTYQRSTKAVFGVLTDFDLVRQKYQALGHADIELVNFEKHADGGVTLVTRRVVPLELPGFAKRVLSPRQNVTQTDTWTAPDAHGVRTGTFTVAAARTPVQVDGTMRLAPSGTRRCTNEITATVRCNIPLIGGKIAGFVAGDTRRAIDHEQAWTSDHLSAG